MLSRSLRWFATAVESHSSLLVVTCLLLGGGLGVLALRAPIDLTFVGMLDRSQPEVARYLDESERFGFGGTLIVLLQDQRDGDAGASKDRLDRGVAKLEQALLGHPDVAGVVGALSRAWILQQLLWLIPSEEFDRLVEAIEQNLPSESSPVPLELLSSGQESAGGLDHLLEAFEERLGAVEIEGERVVQVRLRQDPLTQTFGNSTYNELLGLIEDALAGSGLRFELSGLPAVAAQDQARTLRTIRRLSPLSLLAVVLLVVLVERRVVVLLAVVGALLLAVAATVGLIGWLAGGLTLMETFFGVTVFGLGIDFAIHLLLRLREERQTGSSIGDSLVRALGGTGRGVVAGGVTTAGAFLVVATAPDPVAVHLGLSGGIGLALCLVFMLILVPVAWRRAERRSGKRPSDVPTCTAANEASEKETDRGQKIWLAGIGRLPLWVARHAVQHPWLHLGLAIALLIAAMMGTPRFALESRVERVFNRDVPAVATVNDIRERFGVSGAPWIVPISSLREAKEVTEALRRRDEVFATVASPTDVLPIDATESDRRRRVLAGVRPRFDRLLKRVSAPLGVAAALSGPESDAALLLEMMRALDRGMEQGPPTEKELPLGLRLQFRGVGAVAGSAGEGTLSASDHWLVYAYSRDSTFDARRARAARLAAQEIAPQATGIGALLEAVLLGPRPWVWKVGLGVILFIALVLAIDLRSRLWIMLALLPVSLASGMTFGLLCWLPMNFNVMTVLVVPLLFGLGVDDGIHVVHRMREGRESRASATGAVGRAILMTTATTCASFAILLFTNHPGLESMAMVMLIGMPLCLLASVSSLPAAASLLMPRPGETAGRTLEGRAATPR